MRPSLFAFRRLRREDFGLLSDWLSRPHVQRWWREPYHMSAIEERYGPVVDGLDPTEMFIVELGDDPVGFLQWYDIDTDPDWKAALVPAGVPSGAAGIDYLIGEEGLIGRGLGSAMIKQFVTERLAAHPATGSVAADVSVDNRRSWRALEKAGFRRIWEGELSSDDPSDQGPSYVYLGDRRDQHT